MNGNKVHLICLRNTFLSLQIQPNIMLCFKFYYAILLVEFLET